MASSWSKWENRFAADFHPVSQLDTKAHREEILAFPVNDANSLFPMFYLIYGSTISHSVTRVESSNEIIHTFARSVDVNAFPLLFPFGPISPLSVFSCKSRQSN